MILLAVIALPLAAALLSALPLPRRVAPVVTLICAAAALALAFAVGAEAAAGREVVAVRGWVEADALSAVILVIVAWVCLLAALYSIGYMAAHAHEERRLRIYYLNLNLFMGALLSVPLLAEPALAWIGVEGTAVFSVLLVAYEGTPEALEAAFKYIALMVMGAAIALLGFLVLFWAQRAAGGGDFTWQGLRATSGMAPALVWTGFVLVLVGFGAKVGFVPLHAWLPDAHSQAPTPACALLSGVKTTIALYCILRLVPLLGATRADAWLEVVGLASAGTAAFLLLQVRDYKRMFAYSTIEHMGVIFTAFGLGAAAHGAALMQLVAHSLTKSFCFFAAGAVLITFGTREIAAVRGVLRRSPVAGLALVFGALAIGGAPPMAVFLSELSILRAGLAGHHYVAIALLVGFVAIAFVGIMRHVNGMALGASEASADAPAVRLPVTARLTLLVGAVPVLVLGVWVPPPVYTLLGRAAEKLAS
jgi:hydrogenase-4 component F